MIVQAIKRRKLLWLTERAASYLGGHLRIDRETKTWSFRSDRAADPGGKGAYFEDCILRKADPTKYNEVRGPKAHTIITTD